MYTRMYLFHSRRYISYTYVPICLSNISEVLIIIYTCKDMYEIAYLDYLHISLYSLYIRMVLNLFCTKGMNDEMIQNLTALMIWRIIIQQHLK